MVAGLQGFSEGRRRPPTPPLSRGGVPVQQLAESQPRPDPGIPAIQRPPFDEETLKGSLGAKFTGWGNKLGEGTAFHFYLALTCKRGQVGGEAVRKGSFGPK